MAAGRGRRPAGMKADPVRSVRVSDEIWEGARRRASYEGVTLSYVMSTFLEGYKARRLNLPRVEVTYPPPEEDEATA